MAVAETTLFERKLKSGIREIPVGEMVVDHRVQRERILPARVKELRAKFDPDLLGVMTVSTRANGETVVIDGMHRREVLLQLGLPDWPAECKVYVNLTLNEEAALFRALNNTRKVSAYDNFRTGVTEGAAEEVAIYQIVKAAGLSLTNVSADGGIACVAALREAYRVDDGKSLRAALNVAVSAWGATAIAVEGPIVRGLAIFFEHHGASVDTAVLIEKLSKFPGGAGNLLGRARSLREIRTASIPRLIAAVVVTVYNKSRRTGQLAEL